MYSYAYDDEDDSFVELPDGNNHLQGSSALQGNHMQGQIQGNHMQSSHNHNHNHIMQTNHLQGGHLPLVQQLSQNDMMEYLNPPEPIQLDPRQALQLVPQPTRGRKPKDPQKPKGKISAFMFFNKAYRPIYRQQYPDVPAPQIGKMLAEKWKNLPENERLPFQLKSNEDQERYNKQMADYVPPPTMSISIGGDGNVQRKRKKDPNKPKGRTSAYMYFSQEYRKKMELEHPGLSVTEISKKLGEKWKSLTREEKTPFDDKAELDKERHVKEMATYVPPPVGMYEIKQKKKKKKKDPNAPKRPLSAFFLFSDDFRSKIREEHPTIPFKEISKRLGEMWRNLTKEQQQPYCDRSETLKQKYIKDVAAYKATLSASSSLLPPPIDLLEDGSLIIT